MGLILKYFKIFFINLIRTLTVTLHFLKNNLVSRRKFCAKKLYSWYLIKKQSPNCRAEAEYAFNLRKPIVPLIMQKNYVPDGWLGLILGAKIFINFSKYEFDECMRKLRNEIKNLVWPSTTTTTQTQSIQVNNTTSNTSNNQDNYARKSLTLSMINQNQTKSQQQQSYEDKREQIRAWSNKVSLEECFSFRF